DGLLNINTNLGMAGPVFSGPATQAQTATISTNSRPDQALFASNLSAGQPVGVLQTATSLEGLSSLVIASAEPKTDSRDKKTLRLSAQDEAPPAAASASTLLLTSLLIPNSPPALTQPTSSTGPTSEQTVVATPQPISRSAPALPELVATAPQPSAPALPAASALLTQASTRSAPALPGSATAPQPAKTSSLEGPKSVSVAAITQPAVGVTAHAAAQTLQAAQAPDALAAAQVLAGSISAAWVAAKSGTSSQAAELGPDMRLDTSAEESVQDAVRLTLSLPAPDLSKRLASKPGNTEVVNWAPLLANQQPNANKAPASGPWESLHLAVPEGFDLEEQEGLLAAPEQDASNNAGQPTQAGPLARPGTEPAQTARGEAALLAAQAELRTAQQQQLADRLGEAAANRLIAQIERGEWKMQMRLQPGKLGRIDVELSMHARGLEAMFSADSALLA
ncbi:MAG: flagellar hook-length control protein FliK, partial [Betaproteobacteria bacterium]|nr:flagellar hook-length control protein FliK [Betaproteobacteria bacterium]